MIYLFVITTFVFLGLWLNARVALRFHKQLATEAVNAGMVLIEENEAQSQRLNEISEISERMKRRLKA